MEIAQANEQEAKRLQATGDRVLKQAIIEKTQLQDYKTQLGEELKDVRAQLADSVKENKQVRGGIFSMYLNYFESSSAIGETDIAMIAGILTGRPEEEVSGSSSDLLQKLSQVHEQARLAMRSVAKALWPSASPPGSMEELVERFKGARRRIRLWKISACREGAREAWAMVKTRYTKLDPNHMARLGPVGPNGEEIPVSLVYDQVEVAAKYSQQDCKLDRLLDGIERGVFESK